MYSINACINAIRVSMVKCLVNGVLVEYFFFDSWGHCYSNQPLDAQTNRIKNLGIHSYAFDIWPCQALVFQ